MPWVINLTRNKNISCGLKKCNARIGWLFAGARANLLRDKLWVSLLAEALFLVFADGRKETSAMDRNWLWFNRRPRSFTAVLQRMLLTHSRPQRPRSFWSAPRIATSGHVQHRKSVIHGLPVTLRMLRAKSDKSDWLWSQSIVLTKPFKTGMSLDRARGHDSWCWPKGARPLGREWLLTVLADRNLSPLRLAHFFTLILLSFIEPTLLDITRSFTQEISIVKSYKVCFSFRFGLPRRWKDKKNWARSSLRPCFIF